MVLEYEEIVLMVILVNLSVNKSLGNNYFQVFMKRKLTRL